MDFKGKVVLISGASGGMGEAITRKLAQEGCNLSLLARREEKLKKLTEEIKKNKIKCIFKKCDVTDKKDVENAVKYTFKEFKRIDIAFLNAGVLKPNPIETMDSSIIINTMKTNFFGDIYFLESLFPIMKKQESAMIVVTSTLPDKRGKAGWGAYGASKAAISLFMESIRAEAKQRYNIDIITVKPGSVETPMIKNYNRPGSISPEKAAYIILKGIKKGKKIIQFPFSQVLMTRIGDLFPTSAYDAVPIYMQKGDDYPITEEK
jgi:NADP-dependent 3-hydroxy acid dehydrogenase YdfG